MDFDEITWALEQKLRRLYIRFSGDTRPSSEPFLSGDSFRKLADHIYENPKYVFRTADVKSGDIIFVKSNFTDIYFSQVHPRITEPYILITHNSDQNIDTSYIKYIDDKILHWFAQNLLTEHPKMSPLPIGLENAHHANAGLKRLYQEHSADITAIREGKIEEVRESRKSRILYIFNSATNPTARGEALAALKECDTADKLNRGSFVSQPTYIDVLRSYLFVASPPGSGEDCHRTWEALYTSTIPIVKESPLTKQLYSLGVPLFTVDEWTDIQCLSKYELIAKYDLLWQHADINTLYFDFWKQLILSKKHVSPQEPISSI